MRLTHAERKETIETKKTNGFATTAVLVTGLALVGAAGLKAQETKIDTSAYTINATGLAIVMMHKASKPVKAGDLLLRTEFIGDAAGFYETKVRRVAGKGVVLSANMEIFMSKHSSDSIRVEYGKELRLGEGILVTTINARKGTVPGTAYVEIKTGEMKKTNEAKAPKEAEKPK